MTTVKNLGYALTLFLIAEVGVSVGVADSATDVVTAQDTKKLVQNNFLETAQKGVVLSGYVDTGYSYNFTGTSQTSSTVNGRLGDDSAQQGDFNLYAVKLALEKALTDENRAQAGFRMDVMIGEDANFMKNRDSGNGSIDNADQDSNSLFLEQAFVAFRVPVGNGWDFNVGKFVSFLGYEALERPVNMNVTFGLLWNQLPFYYTGVLSSYKFDEYLDGKLGVANGSGSDNMTTTSGQGDGVALLAGLNITAPGGNANWTHNFQYSTASENDTSYSVPDNSEPIYAAYGASNANGYTLIYDSWGNWSPKFADDKLLFAFDAILGSFSGAAGATTWYGAAAYTKYQFNDWFSLASRAEFVGSNNAGKFGVNGAQTTQNDNFGHNTGNNLWEYTITAGFNVMENMMIRAEYRLDWGAGAVGGSSASTDGPAVSGSGGPAHYAGAEVVYSF